jgi:hypothetical protein
MLNRDRNSMENFTDINFVANLVGLLPNKLETCPTCDSVINETNELIDTERYTANERTGLCDACYDPTPYYPDLGF